MYTYAAGHTRSSGVAGMKRSKRLRIKRSKYQYLRYAILLSVLLFFIFVPLSSWYANNKISYNHSHLVGLSYGPMMGSTYAALDWFYSMWDDPVTAATSNNGSLWAFTILGVPFSDPLGLISELINSVKFPLKYLIGGLIPFVVVLLLGRVFCSWLCPMTVLYGVTGYIRSIMLRVGIPLMSVRLERKTRVIVFWGGLVLSYLFGAWVWHFILPYISFTHEMFSYFVFSTFNVGFYFIIALLVLDIGLVPGQFCNSVCPTGFLLSYLGKFSVVKLRVEASKCPSGCTLCNKVCPVELFPKEGDLYSCHLCLKCVDNCPTTNIALGLNPLYKKPNPGYEKLEEVAQHETA